MDIQYSYILWYCSLFGFRYKKSALPIFLIDKQASFPIQWPDCFLPSQVYVSHRPVSHAQWYLVTEEGQSLWRLWPYLKDSFSFRETWGFSENSGAMQLPVHFSLCQICHNYLSPNVFLSKSSVCKFPSQSLLPGIVFSAAQWSIPKSEDSTFFYFLGWVQLCFVLSYYQSTFSIPFLYRILTMKIIKKQLKALCKIESVIPWNLWSHWIVKGEDISHIVSVVIKSRSYNKS